MTGSRDNKPLSSNDRIDKNPGHSVRFYMRHGFQAAVGADLEKTRSRVGRALDNLLDSGRLKSRVARILMFRIDHCLDAHRHIALRTRINHRQESGGTVAAGRLGERACSLEVAFGRPEVDKHIHYPATAANLLLIEVASEVDFGQARTCALFQQQPRLAEHFRLPTSAAYGSELTVIADDHLCANLARGRTAYVDHRRERKWFVALERAQGFGPDLLTRHFHLSAFFAFPRFSPFRAAPLSPRHHTRQEPRGLHCRIILT